MEQNQLNHDAASITPKQVDKIVGENIRELRKKNNLSQAELGKLLDVTFQQVQKYERGMNRISAGKMFIITREFETTIDRLYEGLIEPSPARHGMIEDLENKIHLISDKKLKAILNLLEI